MLMSACVFQPKRFIISSSEEEENVDKSNFYHFRPCVLTLYLSHSTAAPITCLQCRGDGLPEQMVDNSPGEMSLTGQQCQELPTKSSPIWGPGMEQWAKSRVSQSSFTQQLAENQQVSIDGSTRTQQEGHLAWGGGGELVGKWSKSTEQWWCDLKPLSLNLL